MALSGMTYSLDYETEQYKPKVWCDCHSATPHKHTGRFYLGYEQCQLCELLMRKTLRKHAANRLL